MDLKPFWVSFILKLKRKEIKIAESLLPNLFLKGIFDLKFLTPI